MTGLPSSMALGGDILCTCGNTPSLDGLFPATHDGRLLTDTERTDGTGSIDFYRCDRCGTVHDYADLETERDAMPWRAGVLELLICDPWERYEARDACAGVLWDSDSRYPDHPQLARMVAATMARTHYDMADESDGSEADRERVKGDTWRVPADIPADELTRFADELISFANTTAAGRAPMVPK